MSCLELANLTKTFPDGTRAVRGIDLSIRAGEFVVLLGPSGCGKTTTLRMIAGLETPSDGRILLGGRDVTRDRPGKRDVGFVFQFYALYPHMTVRQNIGFPLECEAQPRRVRARRVSELADQLGLADLLDRFPGQLGGGDQQRVALARAIVREPAVQLMDEPLGTLDADLRLEMREFIRRQQMRLGVTTVYVTHDQEEAMSLADRVVVMEGGRIRHVGPPTEVYDRPASLFVANFVGSPGMNFLPGAVVSADGACRFTPAGAATSIELGRPIRPGRAILGIRGEHVSIGGSGPFRAEVTLDEYQGSARSLHVRTEFDADLVLRTPATASCGVGQAVRLDFDPDHACFFDADTGLRL